MIERALLCVRAQSHPTLCDPMDYIACRAPSSIEFSQQEYWSGLPFPSPGIEPSSLASPALADGFFTVEPPGGGGQRKDLGGGAGSGEGQADGVTTGYSRFTGGTPGVSRSRGRLGLVLPRGRNSWARC